MNVLLNDFNTTVIKTRSRGYVMIDTRWVGDHWESMAFKCNAKGGVTDWDHPLDGGWYRTKENADKGHNKMIEKWTNE
jgi:hypothetical protein